MESKGILRGVRWELNKPIVELELDRLSEDIPDCELLIKITKWRNKRSLDSNAYFHCIVDKIAKSTSQSRFRVKNTLIARYGQVETINGQPMVYKTNAPEEYMLEQEFIHSYPCKVEEQDGKTITFYKIYRGSHTYNSLEMSQLIEGTVIEAKELGIETLTPLELARMNAEWGN